MRDQRLGWAPDYVDAMLHMMDAMELDGRGNDYVISSGVQHSVMELMSIAFDYVGFRGWEEFLIQNSDELRRIDPNSLLGDSGKIARDLGWFPKVEFRKIIELLIDNEICDMTGRKNRDWVNT
jgi:GDPmannose 4,6-dehydratase